MNESTQERFDREFLDCKLGTTDERDAIHRKEFLALIEQEKTAAITAYKEGSTHSYNDGCGEPLHNSIPNEMREAARENKAIVEKMQAMRSGYASIVPDDIVYSEWEKSFIKKFYIYDMEKDSPAGAEREAIRMIRSHLEGEISAARLDERQYIRSLEAKKNTFLAEELKKRDAPVDTVEKFTELGTPWS